MAHRFSEARSRLAMVDAGGPLSVPAGQLSLSIDQACGIRLDDVLDTRKRMAAETPTLEHFVPLGALLAELGEFNEADRTYVRALREYKDVSAFAVSWVCFQLGSLWGELVPESQPSRAARWYQKAIEYLPSYVKARVHLAELYVNGGHAGEAEDLLLPVVSVGDPEVHWRLADVMVALGRYSDAEEQMEAAHSRFEVLLTKHKLAFADHGAEFYSGTGNDAARALELARANVANRPTLRAFEQAYEIAVANRESRVAVQILADGARLWGNTSAFKLSRLAACETEPSENNDGFISRCTSIEQNHNN
jgi:tetratricopeptide (TPR) repeat protein